MPIEIRELIIKTTIDSQLNNSGRLTPDNVELFGKRLKKQILNECKELIAQKMKEEKER